MRLPNVATLICILACSASPAIAQDGQGVTTATTPKPVKEKKVCRTDEQTTTGTIMPSRVCHTPEQWKVIDGGRSANDAKAQQSGRPRTAETN